MQKKKMQKKIPLKIIRAKVLGFCFGVERAYKLAHQHPQARLLGDLIHNKAALQELRKIRGGKAAQKAEVLVRTHGLAQQQLALLKARQLKIIDATCPFVQKVRQVIKNFQTRGLSLVLVGRRAHPEVQALVADFPTILVVSAVPDLRLKKFAGQQVGLVAQTTETLENLNQVSLALRSLGAQVKVARTVCAATRARQLATRQLARQVDLVLVVGDRQSNNSQQLLALARQSKPTFLVESEKEVQRVWLRGVQRVGLAAGASTPEFLIQRVEERVKGLAWS